MTRSKILSFLDGIEQAVAELLDPKFDDAILGLTETPDCRFSVAYDISRVIDVIQREGGSEISRFDALSLFENDLFPLAQKDGGPVFVDTRFAE